MRTVLTIGREPDNDLVFNLPIVSGHHARVTWEGVPGQAIIEDLGSSNGTAIGQLDRKITRSTLTASDTVYFGNHPVPGSELLAWVDPSLAPPLVLQGPEMLIGRDPSCQRVIDRATISSRHARLKRAEGRIILEDLGSSNGTFVNGRRIDAPTEVRVGDLIGLGVDSFRLAIGASAVAGTVRMDAIKPAASYSQRAEPTMRVESPSTATASSASVWGSPITLLALLIQAPILAVGSGLVSGSVASALFLLSLAAVWFGLSTAVFGLLLDPSRPKGGRRSAGLPASWPSRLAILGGLVVVECVLALVVAFPMGGLKAPAVPALGLLILASGVGLALGTLIVLLAPSPTVAWSGLGAALVALCLFGGGPWSLPRSALPIRVVSNVAPSRWAFEGLLVSESDVRPALTPGEGADASRGRDLAEDYFPAQSDRMGARADAMALASMLIGLLGLGFFFVKVSGDGR